MVQVEVWLENTEVIRWGWCDEKGKFDYYLFPAEQKLIGRCKATPEAVAALAGVDIDIAAAALVQPGEPVFIRKEPVPPLSVDLYLVVYPCQKRTNKHKHKHKRK
jgi:hypothetical protein